MSYSDYENSKEGGSPVELYEFVQGIQTWYFSSGAEIIFRNGKTYTRIPVQRDRVKQSPEVFKNGLKITFPRDDQFARQYLGFAPEEPTTVTVLRGHLLDPDQEFVFYWKGRVAGAKASNNTIDVDCESIFTSIRRPGLRARFEYTCRRTLYTRGCYVDRELHKVQGEVISLGGGISIWIDEAGARPAGYYTGGMLLSKDGVARFITNHTGSIVTLSRPLEGLAVGALVSIYPGCDHLWQTCKNKFNNLDNFGGFPYIPGRNPFDGSSLF